MSAHALATDERSSTLLDTIADAVVLYGADGEVVARNALSRHLMGADDAALRLGTRASVNGWLDGQRAPLAPGRHPAELARRGGAAVTDVVAVRRPDGMRRWVRATATVVDDAAHAGAIALTLSDITDLRDARVNLERSNEDLRRMAMVASHDLGAPLAMLRRELASIRADELHDAAAQRLHRAREAADIMQELLGAVLAYAQVDRAVAVSEPFELAAVAVEALVILGPRLEASGATVQVGELPAVVADRVLVRQLLQNLVGNAITHHPAPPRASSCAAERRRGAPVLIVEDDGDGIPASDRERVFGLFARGETPSPGHGIGLSTAKRIVELHGGRIWIEQAEPHGARFCMTLAAPAQAR